jgi:hypothetical protein
VGGLEDVADVPDQRAAALVEDVRGWSLSMALATTGTTSGRNGMSTVRLKPSAGIGEGNRDSPRDEEVLEETTTDKTCGHARAGAR